MKPKKIRTQIIISPRYYIAIFSSTVLLIFFLTYILITLDFPLKPAPRLSPSLSFNEKIKWLKPNAESCDILIIGSSIALNDIDGPYLQKELPNYSIVNAGAWGLSIAETSNFLEIIAPICNPKVVILAVDYSAFILTPSVQNWSAISKYFERGWLVSESSYIHNMDAIHYLKTYISRSKRAKMGNKIYDSLNFDQTGGVLLESAGFKIDLKRWDGFLTAVPRSNPLVTNNFEALSKVHKTATNAGAQLIIVTAPLRDIAFKSLPTNITSQLWSEVAIWSIDKNVTVLNESKYLKLDDSNFVDYDHLNSKGARVLTQKMLQKIKIILGKK